MKNCMKVLWIGVLCMSAAYAQRKMENLGRGVVVTRTANAEALVSWRLLGTEPWDMGFNVYRSANGGAPVKLNGSPLTGATQYYDRTLNITQANAYQVRGVIGGVEQSASSAYALKANTPVQPFFEIPIRARANYTVGHVWVGDLNGDGEYDFVFTRMPSLAENTILLEAYLRDGTYLWTLDCGPNSLNRNNIEPGSSALFVGHGDNITVWDINSDGKSEVIVRTSNGVRFGDGATLQFTSSNDRQFISILNGMTGSELARADVPTDIIAHGPVNGHMGVAYLDGINPSVIYSAKNRRNDGGFEMMVNAYTLSGTTLQRTWKYVRDGRGGSDGHNIRIADTDGDGKDEVIPWGFALNPNGTLKWVLGGNAVHGDRFFIAKLDPNRPGLQGYAIQQDHPSFMYWLYYDARDGKVIHSQNGSTISDLARGMAGDLDPRHAGYEFWTFTDRIYNINGSGTSTAMPSGAYPNLRIWWDGDLLSENLDGKKFTKWDYNASVLNRIYTAPSNYAAELTRVVPSFYGDILGDWREEVVYASGAQNSLVVYTTPYSTDHRIYTLPHNPKYRADMAVRGYAQSHMVDYYLGNGMATPPRPNIVLVGASSSSRISSSSQLASSSSVAFSSSSDTPVGIIAAIEKTSSSRHVRIRDIHGAIVRENVLSENSSNLLQGLGSGLYIIEAFDSRKWTRKIVAHQP